MEVKIPFNAWSRARLKLNHKRATSRTKIYVGDYFIVDKIKYRMIGWMKFPTEYIINYLYHIEGAESPEELRKVLKGIFRGKQPPEYLYTHFFDEVEKPTRSSRKSQSKEKYKHIGKYLDVRL